MVYDDVTIEPDVREVAVYNSNLPAQQSVAPTKEGSQIDAVMRLSELAWARPRNEVDALKKCLAAADPSWVWRVPNRGEGLSVKCARSIVRHYKNVAVIPNIQDTMIPGKDGELVPAWHMTVLALDMENMVVQSASATTPKPERIYKNGKPEADLAYTQRCFQQQLAFLGRVERNATMKIVPGEWQAQIKAEVERREKGKPLAERIPKLVAALENMGITAGDIKKVIGCAPEQMSEAQYHDLLGRGAAVKEGEMSRDAAFPELDPANGKPLHEQSVIMSKLQADIKAAGYTDSSALALAKELYGPDNVPRLDVLTREQGADLVAQMKARPING